jgi:glycosyltransferase involved in cell wall biosynthesis
MLEESCRSEDFDVLHVEHIRGTSFMNGARAKARVLDAVDCMEPLLARIAQHKKNPLYKYVVSIESRRIGKEESCLSEKFDKIIITSERERDLLRERDPVAPVDVVPIGVDLNKFKPVDNSQDSMKLVFTGKMSYFPNAEAVLWFANNVYPKLKEKLPKIKLTIAGAEPGPDVLELNKMEGIEVTGFVPELESVLQQSGIAICPLRIAAGAQFKVIEAMACGLPVVASPLAARTIKNCDSMLKAETVNEWVDVICRLVSNKTQARAIGMANHEYVENNYSWKSSVDLLENTYRGALVPIDHAGTITGQTY